MATGFGGSPPDPRLSASIELSRRDASGLCDLVGIGEALPRKGIATEEQPPALLEIEPACTRRNEDLVQARMLGEPGAGLGTGVARQVVGDNVDIATRVIRLDILQESDVVCRVARSGTSGQLLAIAHPQCPVDPGFLRSPAVIQRRFDAVSSGRPTWGWGEGPWNYWPEFIGADGRRPFGRLGVVGDDRGPFGTKSSSSLLPQLWVRRQRTPSRSKMVRI